MSASTDDSRSNGDRAAGVKRLKAALAERKLARADRETAKTSGAGFPKPANQAGKKSSA